MECQAICPLGSVLERGRLGQGGPRNQWSRTVRGKTVVVALSAEQFAWMRQAITHQREAWAIMEQMHRLSLEYPWKKLPSTTRRKRLRGQGTGQKSSGVPRSLGLA